MHCIARCFANTSKLVQRTSKTFARKPPTSRILTNIAAMYKKLCSNVLKHVQTNEFHCIARCIAQVWTHLWIESYLRDRRQRVSCEGKLSDWLPIRSGVPQGSMAGPLLFALYISSIRGVWTLQVSCLRGWCPSLYCLPEDIARTIQLLNDDLGRFSLWAKSLFLITNPSKTQALVVATNNFVTTLSSLNLPSVMLNANPIPFSNNAKNLGIYIDTTLSWSRHVSEIRKKVFYSLHTLSKFRNVFPIYLKKKLIESLILPIFDYCVLWT